MQVATHDVVYNMHSAANEPALCVEPGEVFKVQTQLNGGDWLNEPSDQWDPSKSRGPNLAVVIKVAGAKPGQLLAVEILDIEPAELAYTGFAGWRNPFSQEVWPNDWDVVTKTCRVHDGRIAWSSKLELEVQPMIGTLGCAPAGEPFSNQIATKHGGNMDVQEVCAGTTVYLPVEVPGALLHIGDMHAIMGDNEIAHSALECAGEVTLRCSLCEPPKSELSNAWLRMENDTHIMVVACENDMQTSLTSAIHELIVWMEEDYGFDPREAYLLLGSVLEGRSTLIHGYAGYPISYIAKVAKRYLIPDPYFEPYHGAMPEAGKAPRTS